VRRWLFWYLLAPQFFLLAGLWRDLGLPPLDVGVLLCMFLAIFADRRALPWLLLGAAAGRAIVDEAGLPVQLLVLGIPVAVLLPLRSLFFGQRWAWQAGAAAVCSIAIPKLAGLFGRVFDQPSQSATLDLVSIVWAALLLPPLLSVLRWLPPLAAFEEDE
jgi:hypothetical protein